MWMLIVAGALAGPPQGVELEDIGRWTQGVKQLTAGPSGCWELSGEVSVRAVLISPADRFTGVGRMELAVEGSLSSRIEEQRWTRMDHDLRSVGGEIEPEQLHEFPVVPLIGTFDAELLDRNQDGRLGESTEGQDSLSVSLSGDGVEVESQGAEAVELLRAAIEEWGGSVSTGYARWSEERGGVEWLEHVPLYDDRARSPEIEVVSLFPDGQELPVALDARWPRTVKVRPEGTPFAITFKNPQMHLRAEPVGEVLIPAVESVSFVVGIMGFTLGYEQTITYMSAAPCSLKEAEPSP